MSFPPGFEGAPRFALPGESSLPSPAALSKVAYRLRWSPNSRALCLTARFGLTTWLPSVRRKKPVWRQRTSIVRAEVRRRSLSVIVSAPPIVGRNYGPHAAYLSSSDFTTSGDELIHFFAADPVTLGSRIAAELTEFAVPEPPSLIAAACGIWLGIMLFRGKLVRRLCRVE